MSEKEVTRTFAPARLVFILSRKRVKLSSIKFTIELHGSRDTTN